MISRCLKWCNLWDENCIQISSCRRNPHQLRRNWMWVYVKRNITPMNWTSIYDWLSALISFMGLSASRQNVRLVISPQFSSLTLIGRVPHISDTKYWCSVLSRRSHKLLYFPINETAGYIWNYICKQLQSNFLWTSCQFLMTRILDNNVGKFYMNYI